MAVQFFPCHGVRLGCVERNGIVPSFHLKTPGGSQGHAVCNLVPTLAKKSIRLAFSHSSNALTSEPSQPKTLDIGEFVVHFLVHLGRTAAEHTRHEYTKAAKRLRYTGGIFT